MKNYTNSKFKIFKNQKQNHYLLNEDLKFNIKKENYRQTNYSKILPYKKFKAKIENKYLNSKINDENMSFVYELSKLFKISQKSFRNLLRLFKGLPHRYEIFLKKKNCIFINDSKSTTFQSTKFALENTKNIYWIVGGLPKKMTRLF